MPHGQRAERPVLRRHAERRGQPVRQAHDVRGQRDQAGHVVRDVPVRAHAEQGEVEAARRRDRLLVAPALRLEVAARRRRGCRSAPRRRPVRPQACRSMKARKVRGSSRGSTSSSRLKPRACARPSQPSRVARAPARRRAAPACGRWAGPASARAASRPPGDVVGDAPRPPPPRAPRTRVASQVPEVDQAHAGGLEDLARLAVGQRVEAPARAAPRSRSSAAAPRRSAGRHMSSVVPRGSPPSSVTSVVQRGAVAVELLHELVGASGCPRGAGARARRGDALRTGRPVSQASVSTASSTADRRCACWWLSRCVGSRPISSRKRRSWARASASTSSGRARGQAVGLGRQPALDVDQARDPLRRQDGRRRRVKVRCRPMPRPGASAGPASGTSAAAGKFTIRVALVTMPRRCASTTPRLIAGERPRSSALTMSRLAPRHRSRSSARLTAPRAGSTSQQQPAAPAAGRARATSGSASDGTALEHAARQHDRVGLGAERRAGAATERAIRASSRAPCSISSRGDGVARARRPSARAAPGRRCGAWAGRARRRAAPARAPSRPPAPRTAAASAASCGPRPSAARTTARSAWWPSQ